MISNITLPKTMKAVVREGTKSVVKEIPIPKARENEFIIKTKAVAINPTDWKHVEFGMAPEGSVLGCDVAGDVVAVGNEVKDVKIGDSLFTMVSGGNAGWPENGAFAEYVVVRDGQYIMPTHDHKLKFAGGDHVPIGPFDTYEGCATAGISLYTVGPGFQYFVEHSVFTPNAKLKQEYFLVWGGSSSLGQIAIQMAKHAGYKVVATCSPKNKEECKKLGAEETFDYRDEHVIAKIKAYTQDRVTGAYDTITEGDTTELCHDAMATDKSAIILVSLPFDASKQLKAQKKENVRIDFPLAYLSIQPVKDWAGTPVHSPNNYMKISEIYINDLNIKMRADPHFLRHMPVTIIPNKFDGIIEGLARLKSGKVSNEKLVIRID